MSKFKILVVDDEKLVRWSLEHALTMEGYAVSTAETGEEAIHKIKGESPDLILLDVKLPGGIDGIAVLAKLREFDKEAIAIMLTAHDTAEAAVRALKLGAYEYICKPFNLDELKIIIKNAFETVSLRRQVAIIRSRQEAEFGFDNIIGKSPAMHEVFTMIKKVSETDTTTILLLGESGTGKDLVARTIHYSGSRKDSPFLEVNCAALPENLLESELLGYEKGAFTDAKSQKKGMFELADGGSIFLDEIGDMKLSMQVKLLKVIEDKRFKRIGGTSDVEVDVRIIAASNRDLAKAVKEEKFREDLYYRLNIVPITIPPLRERKEDIPLLIKFFIDKFNSEFKKDVKGISKKAEELLLNYAWPGNVREIKNVIERAMILENIGIISDSHLPIEIGGYESVPVKEIKGLFKIPLQGIDMEEVEKELVRQALDMAVGNQTRAAKLLNIKRDALRYKMQKFGFLAEK